MTDENRSDVDRRFGTVVSWAMMKKPLYEP